MDMDTIVEGEIQVQSGNQFFTHRHDANPRNVDIATRFFKMKYGITRHKAARAIANYSRDFKEEATKKGRKGRVFPVVKGLGLPSYSELREIFKDAYNVDVSLPRGLTNYAASFRNVLPSSGGYTRRIGGTRSTH